MKKDEMIGQARLEKSEEWHLWKWRCLKRTNETSNRQDRDELPCKSITCNYWRG